MLPKLFRAVLYRLNVFVCAGVFVVVASVIAIAQLLHPSQAFAAGQLGTHLAHFDRGAQMSALDMIRTKVANAIGYPITMNVGVDWKTADIQQLADKATGFAVMIRVTEITSQTTSTQVKNFAQELNGVNWNVPVAPTVKPTVVLGNELNNLQNEWKDTGVTVTQAGTQYARDLFPYLATLNRTKYDVAPSPVDPYNLDYSWLEFVTGASPAYTTSLILAMNLYETSTANASTTINTEKSGMHNLSASVIVTEYGPQNPKSSLSEYVQFYTSNPLPDQVKIGTVLLPNYCDSTKGVFGTYYWVEGEIYDISGKDIDPSTCSTTTDTTGTSTVSYSDESKNVDSEVKGIYVYKDIYADMVKFGYDTEQGKQAGESRAARYIMMCAPQFWIGAQVDGDKRDIYWNGMVDKLTTLEAECKGANGASSVLDASWGTNEPNCLFDPIQGNFTVLNQNISSPLYRKTSFDANGQQKNNNRAESFETFFGTTTKEGRKTGDVVLQSPEKRILSGQQYCAQSMNYLKAIEVLCKDKEQAQTADGKTIQEPGRCALDNEFITSTGTTRRYLEVLGQAREESGRHGIVDPVEYCLLPPEEQNEQLNTDLVQVQPLTKNAFKIGYLVYYSTGRYKRAYGGGQEEMKTEEDCDAFWGVNPGSTKCIAGPATSLYFHPIYRTFDELFSKVTFNIIPFLVPANVFSRAGHQEILVNPAGGGDGTDYKGKQNAVFSSPYFQVYSALMPKWKTDALLQQEGDRQTAVAAAMEYGATVNGNWNTYNDKHNDKPYVYCPLCDPFNGYDGKRKTDVNKETKAMLPFAKVIWNRINAGIYAKEFTEKLQSEGYAEAKDLGLDSATRGDTAQVAVPPDDWATCNVAPQLVRGESANSLTAKGTISQKGTDEKGTDGSESLWGTVKNSITDLKAIVRDPSSAREDKYAYYIRGYLLLPQEYGLLMKTELDMLKLFATPAQQNKILITEQKSNAFGSFDALADPASPDYDEQVPPFNRFLRINGQIFTLEDTTLSSSGRHGKIGSGDGTALYATETNEEFDARKKTPACKGSKGENICEQKHIEITAKLNSWDPGYNDGKADYRPILPGGWLARGIFEIMAHVLSRPGLANYQEKYCGLEDYWLGGNCGGTIVAGAGSSNGSGSGAGSGTGSGAGTGNGTSCLDATTVVPVIPGSSPPSSSGVKSFTQSSTLNTIITQAANWAKVPPAVLAGFSIAEGQMHLYSEAEIQSASTPDGYIGALCTPSIDGCGSMGPMQFTTLIGKDPIKCPQGKDLNTWNVSAAFTGQPFSYSSTIAGARTSGIPNPANVVDSIYAAAAFVKGLSHTSSAGGWGTAEYNQVGEGFHGSCKDTYSYHRFYSMITTMNAGLSGGQPTSVQKERIGMGDDKTPGALTYCEFLELYATPRQ